jgi:hypothetical protein
MKVKEGGGGGGEKADTATSMHSCYYSRVERARKHFFNIPPPPTCMCTHISTRVLSSSMHTAVQLRLLHSYVCILLASMHIRARIWILLLVVIVARV